ncbi:right-handed parallel beta-helix repeat-containing protein [Chitinophaga sedimenti]|uniref:right-handed parallel beta-helix repeat-containing protein n=1 Tax=Chitinophaga sedimenti TaxID=2033606 RepID=UPI00200454F5|nr:right-handed parallel beta-helix repeat-containing protein [Chitinophaga sedimenti]MCK7556824.1 right-handed parallel beta-helix repeat-containing protein [Chitinophaga sedimenti]
MRFLALLLLFCRPVSAAVLHIGAGQAYADITAAGVAAKPGDTLLLHSGEYAGNQSLRLQGTFNKWICILAEKNVVFKGGVTAWNCTDIAYVHIEGITFKGQTGNGVNIDDGGSYDTPSHHLRLEKCVFRDMAATGNNDLLKLSGVDEMTIVECRFENGAQGGSGIDMVGCHNGLVRQCHFENMGSNAVQMKGGSSDIRVEACYFKNCGSRAINLGGSTGLPFFRPADARYEATRLQVYSCIFIGSEVPVAFVGCTHSEVVNNTIYKPGRWVIRILQENKDTVRFARCGDNTFSNNIVYVDAQLRTACSVDQGTLPDRFAYANNLWYHEGDVQWRGVAGKHSITGKSPLLREDLSIGAESPAAGAGLPVQQPNTDYSGRSFSKNRSIGAYEF